MATAKKATTEMPDAPNPQVESLMEDNREMVAENKVLLREIEQLKDAAMLAEKQRASTAELHQAEIKRLQEIIGQSSQRQGTAVPEAMLEGARGALRKIIGSLAVVAEGAAATEMRHKVHVVAAGLNREERAELVEYINRLHGATEAVKQEAALLLV